MVPVVSETSVCLSPASAPLRRIKKYFPSPDTWQAKHQASEKHLGNIKIKSLSSSISGEVHLNVFVDFFPGKCEPLSSYCFEISTF